MIEKLAGPILVTVAYVAVYYAFIVNILRVKTRLGKAHRARGESFDRYGSGNREMLAADRVQLNMLEQMPPFLVLLWLHAVFIDARSATIAGAVYVATRALYPLLYGKSAQGGAPTRIMLVTFTGYGIVAFLAISLVWASVRAFL